MPFELLSTALSTFAALIAVGALTRTHRALAHVHGLRNELQARLALIEAKRAPASAALVEDLHRTLTGLQSDCAADRATLGKVADRLHRLAGRVQGMQAHERLNAEPEPQDRESLRARLLRGQHVPGAAGGTGHE